MKVEDSLIRMYKLGFDQGVDTCIQIIRIMKPENVNDSKKIIKNECQVFLDKMVEKLSS